MKNSSEAVKKRANNVFRSCFLAQCLSRTGSLLLWHLVVSLAFRVRIVALLIPASALRILQVSALIRHLVHLKAGGQSVITLPNHRHRKPAKPPSQ